MFIIIGIMFAGMLLGFLLRKQRLSWIHKVITVFIWLLLFLLGIDVGSNQEIINGLHTIGLEAVILTLAAVLGSGKNISRGLSERKLRSVCGSFPTLMPTLNINAHRA